MKKDRLDEYLHTNHSDLLSLNHLVFKSKPEYFDNADRLLSYLDELQKLYDELRQRLGKQQEKIIITSGFRCPILNNRVKGVYNSRHTLALAVDIWCSDLDALYNLAQASVNLKKKYGVEDIIREKSWIHIELSEDKK